MPYLFYKDVPVLKLKESEGVMEVSKVLAPEYIPLSLSNNCDSKNFNDWLNKRVLPSKREGLEQVIKQFGKDFLKNKNYASLTDHYWIKKRDETYRKINFFENRYDTQVGDMFFTPWIKMQKSKEIHSPDLTCGGILKKRWIQDKNKNSFLIKAGSKKTHQDPLSEVLVSTVVERMDKECLKSAGYELHIEGLEMCSITKNFVTIDTELVSLKDIYFNVQKEENESAYKHTLKCIEAYNIPNGREYLNWMIFVDNLTANEDRNLSNIGFIRDAKTLEFIGPAPLFDCANAYWNTGAINEDEKSKLFKQEEKNIVKKLKKEVDIDAVFKDGGYKEVIKKYPHISNEKKENLIKEIKKQNNRFSINKNANIDER